MENKSTVLSDAYVKKQADFYLDTACVGSVILYYYR